MPTPAPSSPILASQPMAPPTGLDQVTVILVTFHSAHCAGDLGRCLAAFPHVTIVDNASGDNTVAELKAALPRAHVLVNERNLGFGAANNRAVATATTPFILLLNPDCQIQVDAVQELIHAMDRLPRASAVGPQLLDRKGHLDLSYCMQANGWRMQGPPAEGDLCVGFLSGACMLIRRQGMQKIGGFDEDFFLYQEDTDLCLRLAAQVGELVLVPSAVATHLSRGSSGGKGRYKAEYIRGYHHIQSKFIFEHKHAGVRINTGRLIRYGLAASLEMALRLALLDLPRASRAWGRARGAWRYRPDMAARQTAS